MALTVPFAQMFISRFAELTTLGKTNIRPIGFALIEIRSVKGPKSGVIDHACGSAGRVPVGGRPFVERGLLQRMGSSQRITLFYF